MAAPADNGLQNVQTYQQASLELLENFGPFCSPEVMNMMFREFNTDFVANLGDTISFSLPTRYYSNAGLVVTSGQFQPSIQRVKTLTVGQTGNVNPYDDTAANVPIAFDAKQLIFNVEAFIDDFGRSAIAELADRIQRNVAAEIPNSTYRYYGSPTGPIINSYAQLDKALRKYDDYGAPKGRRVVIMPDTAVSDVISNGLNQFAINRGNEDAQSWEIAEHGMTKYYTSNMLPTHFAGNVGVNGTQLTVTNISVDGTTVTLTGAGISDADAIKKDDILEFDYDKLTNLYFLTFIGHQPSQQKPQIRATANAASDGTGEVIITVDPPLIVADNPLTKANANLNLDPTTALSGAGVHVRALPSHRCGLLMGGNAFYLGMPALPDQDPFKTANLYDEETGVSIRLTKGASFGGNVYGYIYDAIWGKTLVPEYALRLIFPVDGGF
jgi:hypothetical protein